MGAIAIAPLNFIGHPTGERILAMTRFLVQGINTKTGGIDSFGIKSFPSEVWETLPTIQPPYELHAIEDAETGKRWTPATLHTFYPSEK